MKSLILYLTLFFLCTSSYSQTTQEISGRITQMGQPLANVNIMVEQTNEGTFSDKSGYYKIKTEAGNTLNYSHTGMRSVNIIIEDVTKILNLEMEPEYEELDEVTVMQRKKLSSQKQLAKDYAFNKDIIKTRFGYMDAKKTNWRTIVIDEDMIRTGGSLDLTSTIEARFIGIVDRTDPINPKFYDRRTSTITERIGEEFRTIEEQRNVFQVDTGQGKEAMVFDVDGQVFENFPVHITTDMVERIAIISGNAAANIYSMRARGGVVVINTKGSNVVYEKDSFKVYDYERLRNNFYVDDTSAVAGKANVPNYLQELQKTNSKEEALSVYQAQSNRYRTSPYFKLNVADYFLKKWKDQEIAIGILEEVADDFSNNAVVLKALAYLYDERGEWEKSTELYKQILRLRPKYAQSYRDLANSMVQSGSYGKALGMHVRYEKMMELNPGLNQSMGIDSIMESEFVNFSTLRAKEIIKNKNSLNEDNVWGARVLIEWNNSEAEFNLQVVHPNTQYFLINHTNSNNADRIKKGKIKGYSSEQIFFDHNDSGTWNINLKYLGNKSYDPTYFKITLYRDWGLPTQSKEIKVYRINERNRNRNVLRFAIAGGIANN